MAKVLKPFRFGDRIVHPGEVIKTTPEHARQLALHGLAEATKGDAAKAAKKPKTPAAEAGAITSGERPRRGQNLLGK